MVGCCFASEKTSGCVYPDEYAKHTQQISNDEMFIKTKRLAEVFFFGFVEEKKGRPENRTSSERKMVLRVLFCPSWFLGWLGFWAEPAILIKWYIRNRHLQLKSFHQFSALYKKLVFCLVSPNPLKPSQNSQEIRLKQLDCPISVLKKLPAGRESPQPKGNQVIDWKGLQRPAQRQDIHDTCNM